MYSGAIGLSYLKYKTFDYHIFYDQHNNENYCKNNTIFLDTFLKDNFLNNADSLILLEELLDFDDDEIITLWKNTKHTVRLKEFYVNNKNNNNVIPIDIRTLLFPCSPLLVYDHYENKNSKDINFSNFIDKMEIKEYFYILLYFFDIEEKDIVLNKKYSKLILNIKKIKKEILCCFKNIGKDDIKMAKKIYNHYSLLKDKVKFFKNKFIGSNQTLEKFYYNNSKNRIVSGYLYKNFLFENNMDIYSWMDLIELIMDSIMEFYSILIILCRKKKYNFLHAGLAHSSNIVWLLRNVYKFESIKDVGFTENNLEFKHNINDIPFLKNCINI